jgi:phosphoribosylformylglycinamidine synthase subunit PurSL
MNSQVHFVQVRQREVVLVESPERIDLREGRGQVASVRGGVRAERSRVYLVPCAISEAALTRIAKDALADPILEDVSVNQWSQGDLAGASAQGSYVLLGRRSGVTDDEGMTAQRVLAEVLPEFAWGGQQCVFSRTLYRFSDALPEAELLAIGRALGNELVDEIAVGSKLPLTLSLPTLDLSTERKTRHISLEQSDTDLLAFSKERSLGLSLAELHAIRDYFRANSAIRVARGYAGDPSECELEILAQTWSEHCKHKEFNALISMSFEGKNYIVDSLFKSFIRKSTEQIREKYRAIGEDWMLTVFSDNAGVVRIDDARLFVLKVETHNSPSALDPVGGAMTGVLGTNRDAFGTGKGGARLLFNTDVLCFGPRDYDKPLLPGQMHPARIMDGVLLGIEHAGNKCGVPTVNGAVVFDERYAGKPLVYCGTGAVMRSHYPNGPSWEKDIQAGYRLVVIGGRVGQDGIHGATFSSSELSGNMSRSVVQIGSPITQKFVADFMEEACLAGLIAGSTDNGAGGLSSSVGELASFSGGASVDLSRVPLKYDGLKPWEIFLSESQERMTLAVRPSELSALLKLASLRDVEATDIGEFTNTGRLQVCYGTEVIADLELHFLHDGVPRKIMTAEWSAPVIAMPRAEPLDVEGALLALLGSANIASRESIVRRFDHEVKGKSVIKSLMGETGHGPQDAAVMRVGFDGHIGVAVASGICPKFGDQDPYHMSLGAFDEALRSLVSVGVRLPLPGEAPSFSACDNFCVPDSDYHAVTNPDGRRKLGQLVRMCEALYDAATFFDVPMTSGKDSMKNDFRAGAVKISAPPTVLYTMVAKIADVRNTITSEFKAPGDLIYLLGHTYEELGSSEFLKLRRDQGGQVPHVRKECARKTYLAHMAAHAEGLIVSSHDLSDGGLLVAVAECTFGNELGAALSLPEIASGWAKALSTEALLFGESHSRLLVSVKAVDQQRFESLVGLEASLLGTVTVEKSLSVKSAKLQSHCEWRLDRLLAAFMPDLRGAKDAS